MISQPLQEKIIGLLVERTGSAISIQNSSIVGGGCINDCYRFDTNQGSCFIKVNNATRYPGMFEAEARGLQMLKQTGTLYIPEVIGYGEAAGENFLLLEFIESGKPVHSFWDDFGKSLAQMHRHTSPTFGLDHNNYIGSLPQRNISHADWDAFFTTERLEYQCKMALDNGRIDSSVTAMFGKLFPRLNDLFPAEPPALLHGDLWSGNYLIGPPPVGQPCIIDPAVYYGHREMDIGMTRLFGGFSPEFYEAYNAEYPLENGWQERTDIANLYPLLVHVNLFGGGYLGQVQQVLRRFV